MPTEKTPPFRIGENVQALIRRVSTEGGDRTKIDTHEERKALEDGMYDAFVLDNPNLRSDRSLQAVYTDVTLSLADGFLLESERARIQENFPGVLTREVEERLFLAGMVERERVGDFSTHLSRAEAEQYYRTLIGIMQWLPDEEHGLLTAEEGDMILPEVYDFVSDEPPRMDAGFTEGKVDLIYPGMSLSGRVVDAVFSELRDGSTKPRSRTEPYISRLMDSHSIVVAVFTDGSQKRLSPAPRRPMAVVRRLYGKGETYIHVTLLQAKQDGSGNESTHWASRDLGKHFFSTRPWNLPQSRYGMLEEK